MNLYQAVLSENNYLENIHKKGEFWGTYSLIFTLFDQSFDKKIIIKNLDYKWHKAVEFQRNLKHFNFW